MAAKQKKESSWKVSVAGLLILLGIGSFILPLLGRQFVVLSWMGGARPVVAIVMVLAAVALFALEVRDRKAKAINPAATQD